MTGFSVVGRSRACWTVGVFRYRQGDSGRMAFEYNLAEARAIGPLPTRPRLRGRVGRESPVAIAAALVAAMCLAGCSGTVNSGDLSAGFGAGPAAPTSESTPNRGVGDFKVGLILPLSANGNAGAAGQAMRNAAEMALAELGESNIQVLPK